jgi:hypothetical protein
MPISQTDLIRALDNSTPYPVELTPVELTYMAERLSDYCIIEKNEESELWQPEEPPVEPGVETPPGSPNPNP